MEEIKKPIPLVQKILCKAAPDGQKLKPSVFNYLFIYEKQPYVYNTLTCGLYRLTQEELDDLQNGRKSTIFAAYGLLVPEERDEARTYTEYVALLRAITGAANGKRFYKIFTTTQCNARCFYCFEDGHEDHPMTAETADKLVEYICKTHCKERVCLYWFGGEPLCNQPIINRICSALTRQNISFYSYIVTNGSLMTPELARSAVKEWNLQGVQITLDGMSEEYRRRKAYVDNYDDPFTLVMNHIRGLLQAGVEVTVRLNLDWNNYDSISELAKYLCSEFADQRLLKVYPALIFEEFFSWKRELQKDRRPELLERWRLLRDYLYQKRKLQFKALPPYPVTSHCMANDPQCAVVNYDGSLFTCQNCDETMRYGSITEGIEKPELYAQWIDNSKVREECESCVFLPLCTCFDLCPNKRNNCKKIRKDSLERKIRNNLDNRKNQAIAEH